MMGIVKIKMKRGILMKWIILFVVLVIFILLFNYGAHKNEIER
jgi:hypothetical protein